jgi:hypothetical protein
LLTCLRLLGFLLLQGVHDLLLGPLSGEEYFPFLACSVVSSTWPSTMSLTLNGLCETGTTS